MTPEQADRIATYLRSDQGWRIVRFPGLPDLDKLTKAELANLARDLHRTGQEVERDLDRAQEAQRTAEYQLREAEDGKAELRERVYNLSMALKAMADVMAGEYEGAGQ